MEILFQPIAEKDFKNLVKKNKPLLSEFIKRIYSIENNNFEGKGKFKNRSIYRFSYQSVSYRIIYHIENGINTIYKIGTRENFYD